MMNMRRAAAYATITISAVAVAGCGSAHSAQPRRPRAAQLTASQVGLLRSYGSGDTVFGLNVLHGATARFDRTLIGPYARVGFGKWGVLAEYDMTGHTSATAAFVPFRQSTGFGQVL